MRMNRPLLISLVMLVLGIVQAFGMEGVGYKEWSIVTCGVLIAFGTGVWQEYIIAKTRKGLINKKTRMVFIILSFAILFALKASIANNIPTHLNDGGPAIFLQVFFTVFGLLLGRGLTKYAMYKRGDILLANVKA